VQRRKQQEAQMVRQQQQAQPQLQEPEQPRAVKQRLGTRSTGAATRTSRRRPTVIPTQRATSITIITTRRALAPLELALSPLRRTSSEHPTNRLSEISMARMTRHMVAQMYLHRLFPPARLNTAKTCTRSWKVWSKYRRVCVVFSQEGWLRRS